MFYVYILKSLINKHFYKGMTSNLNRRLYEHEKGYNITTRNYLPIKLIHVEICNSRIEARKVKSCLNQDLEEKL